MEQKLAVCLAAILGLCIWFGFGPWPLVANLGAVLLAAAGAGTAIWLAGGRRSAPVPPASGHAFAVAMPGVAPVSVRHSATAAAFRLEEVLSGALTLATLHLDGRRTEVIVHLSPALPPALLGEGEVLRKLLGRLLDLAVRSARDGSVRLSVEVARQGMEQIDIEFTVETGWIKTLPLAPARRRRRTSRQALSPFALGRMIIRHLAMSAGGQLEFFDQGGVLARYSASFGLPAGGAGVNQPWGIDESLPRIGKRVLIIDDNASSRDSMAEMLRHFGLFPESRDSAQSALEGLTQASAASYACILIDRYMPVLDGVDTAARLRQALGQSCPPLVLLVPPGGMVDLLPDREFFADILAKPVLPSHLLACLSALFPSGQQRKKPREAVKRLRGKHLLLVDGEPQRREVLSDILGLVGMDVVSVGDALSLMEALGEAIPDCLLLARRLPDAEGEALIRSLREAGLHDLPIVVILPGLQPGEREGCLAAGANETVPAPLERDALLAAVSRSLGGAAFRPGKAAKASDDEFQMAGARNALPPLPPGLDIDVALRRLHGRTELFLNALKSFRDSRGESFQRDFRVAILAADWDLSERLAAELRSTAAGIGAMDISEAAGRLERAIREGRHGEVRMLLSVVTEKLRSLVEGLAKIS